MSFYYVSASGDTVGPITEERLHQLYSTGEITTVSPVICEGESQWVTIRDYFSEPRWSPPAPPLAQHLPAPDAKLPWWNTPLFCFIYIEAMLFVFICLICIIESLHGDPSGKLSSFLFLLGAAIYGARYYCGWIWRGTTRRRLFGSLYTTIGFSLLVLSIAFVKSSH